MQFYLDIFSPITHLKSWTLRNDILYFQRRNFYLKLSQLAFFNFFIKFRVRNKKILYRKNSDQNGDFYPSNFRDDQHQQAPIVALVPEQPLSLKSLKSLDQHSRVPMPSLWWVQYIT
jgi:hypothetical protein